MDTPSLRQRWLGAKLMDLRLRAGLPLLSAAAEVIGRSAPSLSRIENGVVSIPPRDLPPILDAYRVADQVLREKLMVVAAEIQEERRGWWMEHGDALAPSYIDRIRLEATASEIWTFEANVLPGLLQTEAYARAAALSRCGPESSPELDDFVAVRMNRQAIFTSPEPPMLRVVLGEGLLRQRTGGDEVFRAQLLELRKRITDPNVTIQVLPFLENAHPGFTGGFTVLRLVSLDLAHIELMSSDIYIEDDDGVDRYLHAFEQLSSLALDPVATDALFAEVLDTL